MGANGAVAKAEAYADSIIEKLDRLVETTEARSVRDQIRYEKAAPLADAGGVARVPLTVRPGVIWLIEQVTTSGGNGGVLEIYLDEAQPQNRVDFIINNAVGLGKSDPNAKLYVPRGGVIIFIFSNQGANAQLGLNVRIKELMPEENAP